MRLSITVRQFFILAILSLTLSWSSRGQAQIAAADLSILKTDSSDPVQAGTNLTYAITVNNEGPDPADTVTMSDPLPAGTTFVSLSSPAGWSCTTPAVGSGGTVTCSIANFTVGSVGFTVTVAVGGGLSTGTLLTNTATVTSTTVDPNPADETATEITTVGTPIAELSVSQADAPDPVLVGTTLVYTITASTTLPDATNAVLTDVLPTGTTFQSILVPSGWNCTTPAVGAGGMITCTATTFPAGSVGLTVTVHVAFSPISTQIENTIVLRVETGGRDDVATNTESTTLSGADLGITKTGPGTVNGGGAVTYMVDVTNDGPSAADGATITDAVPATLSNVTITCTATGRAECPVTTGLTTLAAVVIPTLPNGGTVSFTISGVAPGSGSLSNSASVAPPTGVIDPGPTANTDGPVATTIVPTRLTVSDVTVNEGAGTATFGVQLSAMVVQSFTLAYATANGSASAGSDYTSRSGTLTFMGSANEVQTVTVPILNDATVEPTETFVVNFSSISNAAVSFDSQAIATITNDDTTALRISDVSRAEGNSGSSGFSFTVTLSNPSASPVTVRYATANGSAVAGSDYTATSGTLTFSVGQTSKPVVVNVTGDTTVESIETFVVNLSNATGASIVDGQGVGTIQNDDTAALRISDVSRAEGNSGSSRFSFTVTLSNPNASPVTVRYATANGSASAGSDYTSRSGTLTFSPGGALAQTATVLVSGDTTVEPNETFLVNLSNASRASIADGQGVGTIQNDDTVALRISDVSRAEGNSGSSGFSFTVTLSNPSASPVTVRYATANGSAVAGSDYTSRSGTLTFSPGQSLTQTVVVDVGGDPMIEPNETFVVNLSNATGGSIADGQGVGTILNDEGSVVRISDVQRGEGNSGTSTFVFTVTLSTPSASAVTVSYATANGTALAGSDYTAVPVLPLTFNAGETSKTVVVNVIGDTVLEPNETVVVNLSNATGATIFDGQGIGTILNDEGPVVGINDVQRGEGNSGTSTFVFTVTLSTPSASAVTVSYATANGTALAGSDYTAVPVLPLTFNAGETSKVVVVTVVGDTVLEPNEAFVVNLSSAKGATIFDGQGEGLILNDEGSVVRINDVSLSERVDVTKDKYLLFTVTVTPTSAGPVTVSYATANGSALAGSDYTATSGTLTFSAGQTSTVVGVLVRGDTVVEPDETFVVNLSNASGATIFDGQGIGTILNDD